MSVAARSTITALSSLVLMAQLSAPADAHKLDGAETIIENGFHGGMSAQQAYQFARSAGYELGSLRTEGKRTKCGELSREEVAFQKGNEANNLKTKRDDGTSAFSFIQSQSFFAQNKSHTNIKAPSSISIRYYGGTIKDMRIHYVRPESTSEDIAEASHDLERRYGKADRSLPSPNGMQMHWYCNGKTQNRPCSLAAKINNAGMTLTFLNQQAYNEAHKRIAAALRQEAEACQK